jgi:hypothetical protein
MLQLVYDRKKELPEPKPRTTKEDIFRTVEIMVQGAEDLRKAWEKRELEEDVTDFLLQRMG